MKMRLFTIFTSVIMYQIMNQKINFLKYLRISKYEILKNMAERVGFEPTNELPRCWFSRPVLSTAQPPLHKKHVILLQF